MDLGKLAELSKRRECQECGEVFLTDPDSNKEGLTAMQKFADHSATHGYTPAQWAEAHKRIQAAKEASKKSQGT